MPKQSRGFWVCSICSQAFDRFEEASYHESVECPNRYPTVNLQSWQHLTPQVPYMMPPSSSIHVEAPREALYASISYDKCFETRVVPLLGQNEPNNLTEADTLSARAIQLFEMNDQVGLRCSGCQGSHMFPQSIRHVGDCVRQIAADHLIACESLPVSTREVLEKDMKKRQQRRKDGDAAMRDEEDSRQLLTEFCTTRCRQTGITDRIPLNTGIQFDDGRDQGKHSDMSLSHAAHLSPPSTRRPSPHAENLFQPSDVYSDRASILPSVFGSSPYDPSIPFHDSSTISTHHRPLHVFDPAPEQQDLRSVPPTVIHHFMPTYNIPPDFPFVQEQGGGWICKFCSHIHPQARDVKYYWISPDRSPPPPDFIDYHLSVCRVFQESQYHIFDYQQYPQNHIGRTSSSIYTTSGRYSGVIEQGSQSFPVGTDSVYIEHPYSSLTMDNPLYESSAFIGSSNPNPNSYRTESQLDEITEAGLTLPQTNAGETSVEYIRAIEFLTHTDKNLSGEEANEVTTLVLEEDKLLLTDYFYFVMKQLRPVRFSEADRRTRGGKRENIAVGYGGLKCVHCSEQPNARKFFWSNVDRLANSFAEIPSHVLKCRRCPQPTKDALLLVKQKHPEQMARLPRGSQKVFFRRMWRRLHDEDPPAEDERESPVFSDMSMAQPSFNFQPSHRVVPNPVAMGSSLLDSPPAGSSGSEESIFLLQRSTEEAAKALADASIQGGPPSPSSRVLLALPDDQKWLSDTDCFIRRQLEVFCATSEEVDNARSDRKYPVVEGQVGIRCIHCAMSKSGARGQAVAYPFNIGGIYEAAREFQRLHLETCENLPFSAKNKLEKLKGSSSLSSVLRKYYVIAANALGLVDTRDGIRAGEKPVPIGSQAAFAFSDDSSPKVSNEMRIGKEDSPPITASTSFEARQASRKRSATEEEQSETRNLKRTAFDTNQSFKED